MRCKNCGWENEPGRSKCEKCNAPLNGSMVDYSHFSNEEGSSSFNNTSDESLKATLRDSVAFGDDRQETATKVCKNCGYEIAQGMTSCPACGYAVSQHANLEEKAHHHQSSHDVEKQKCPKCGMAIMAGARFCSNCGHTLRMGTVNAWDNPYNTDYCTLRPIAWSKENREYAPITYSGDSIILNRANTDPNNETITSKVQALLTHSDGGWFIEDKSDQKTTMIRVIKKTRLEPGDIIALGNRLFEFNG